MTRRDLGGGYYEDVYSFEGQIPELDGVYEITVRRQNYRGLFGINLEMRSRILFSTEELQTKQHLKNGENQTSDYTWEERKYLGEGVETHFARLMSGKRVGMKQERTFRYVNFACIGPQWCSPAANSRQIEEDEHTRMGADVWIPAGDEELELPDGKVPTLVFDNFRERIWYDPISEQIVRRGRPNYNNGYGINRLRLSSFP